MNGVPTAYVVMMLLLLLAIDWPHRPVLIEPQRRTSKKFLMGYNVVLRCHTFLPLRGTAPMSDHSLFRSWLKRQRAKRGLTQETLGELVGYSVQTIRKIEVGYRRPSLQLAFRLAEVLQLPPEEQEAWMSAARAVAEPDDLEESPTPGPTASIHTLPAYLTPFVGREREQAELAGLLSRPDCRLVTLLGPGGVGKTRLAVELGRTIAGFADGVTFVSLASTAAHTGIVPAIADALSFAFSGTADPFKQLLTYLRERRVLLILDNLEQLLDPAGATLGVIERLVTETAAVRVLATSRERLRLAGEWVLELDGLPVPGSPDTVAAVEATALTLFIKHAERVDRTFQRTTEREAVIAKICGLVGGLPLGIELAAAWTRVLSLDEIAHELTHSLDTAHLSPGTAPTRHHSLRAVVEYSWQRLTAAERATLRQLAAFQGGFTREAARQVAGATLETLAALTDKSLLRRGDNGRYDLHQVIKQFAEDRLQEEHDEWAAVCGRHAAYYLRLAAERDQRLKSAEQVAAMAEIGAEFANIGAAWQWAAAHGQFDELEQAAEVLHWYFEMRSWPQEGTVLFGQAVEQLRLQRAGLAEDMWQRNLGRMLGHYGYVAMRAKAAAEVEAALAESIALLTPIDDPLGLARTLVGQGIAAHWAGAYAEARRLLDHAIVLTEQTGDRYMRAGALTWTGMVAHAVGTYEEAEAQFSLALAAWRELGLPRGQVWCITSSCPTLLALGKVDEAQRLLQGSLALSQSTDDRFGTATSLHYLGRTAVQKGEAEEAVAYLREAMPLLGVTGSWEHAQAINDLAGALWQSGASDEARRTYVTALATALQGQLLPEALRALVGVARCATESEDQRTALALATRVIADQASSEEVRRSAVELQNVAGARLPAEEAAQIEERARAEPLTRILSELTLRAWSQEP